jgi:hypothetical protein
MHAIAERLLTGIDGAQLAGSKGPDTSRRSSVPM